jgi:hypothetical protein
MRADVVGELLVVERLGLRHRLGEDLSGGIGIGRIGEAERIDAEAGSPLLILLQELVGAGELQARGRNVELVVDQAVDERPELLLDPGHEQAEEGAAIKFRFELDLV